MRAGVMAVAAASFVVFGMLTGAVQAQVQQGPYLQPNVPNARPGPARPPASPAPAFEPGAPLPGVGQDQPYQIGPGDRLRITVFGEADLTGEFEVGSGGGVSFPLVGEVPARGLTLRALEQRLTALLKDGFLVNPRVSVEVINYRPFFILGEVTRPGGYPYVSGMTVVTAIALAGGYTPRASRRRMLIVRTLNRTRNEIEATEETTVLPGDVITVHERFL